MKPSLIYGILFLFFCGISQAQDLQEVSLDDSWKLKIQNLAPEKSTFKSSGKKKVLIFSLHTGFEHWVIPHTEEMLKIIGQKSGIFEMVASKNIEEFEAGNLENYDAIILNNTCSKPDHRNLFWDKLREESNEDSVILMKEALQLEKNLLDYVANGGGLMVLHGGITTQNSSTEFGKLIGGSFDYHPPQQNFRVYLEDPEHPLVQAFPKEGFEHIDEPYFYKNAYDKGDFKPLLYFKNSEIEKQRNGQTDPREKIYVAWIRSEGDGKVFYASPSHNAQSFENPDLLQFYLDGMQYVIGDVECDETPVGR
ncbi:ThuA domain-containing protein [Algoriphagus hitonicola]|uniref:Trehalose utilisation n=1 Tax=Algoriphagus hitonicola TaxID=435880 RepID=A0A1I2XAS3_9BACT|nr:ThuA domain-containing protein [Algoriphagus hitonicola]SFH10595.1 Trehalose utilisation [Algoriphagus hitonicola]